MSTLTKILIVVLVVLVLLASVLFIQQAAVPQNYKAAFGAVKQRLEVAEAENGNQQLANKVLLGYYQEAKARGDSLADEMARTLVARDAQIAQLNAQGATHSGRLNELTASLAAIQKDLNGQIGLNQTLTGQLDAHRKQNAELTDQGHRAQDTIRDYMANNEILTKSQRKLQEECAGLKQENADLRGKLETAGVKAPAGPTVKPPKIEATVTAVTKDLAQVNVGSADGVQKDMEFVIYRDSTFVGHLRIAEVYASSAAGVIVDAQRDVQKGDKATTSLE